MSKATHESTAEERERTQVSDDGLWQAKRQVEHALTAGLIPDASTQAAIRVVLRAVAVAERREPVRHDAEIAGLRFRVEAACDGYANLFDSDVPADVFEEGDYKRGAADAAEAIRAVALALDANRD